MSRRALEFERRNSSRLLNRAYRIDTNSIKLNPNNTWAHEFRKVQICWSLLKQRKKFITEAIFLTGGRADIFILDDCRVIEVLGTEKLQDCKDKVFSKKYPCEVEVYANDAKKEWKEDDYVTIKFGE